MSTGHGHVTPLPDGLKARCGGPGLCAQCSQEAATAAFQGATGDTAAAATKCPNCGAELTVAAREPVRVTESTGVAEAVIDGKRTFAERQDLVRDALTARVKSSTGAMYVWVGVVDMTDTDVVYTCADLDDLMQCTYAIGDDAAVTLGTPTDVVRTYIPAATVRNPPPEADAPGMDDDALESKGATRSTEAVRDRIAGRVIEAKGTDDGGGRIYRVRIIEYGTSKNGNRYPADVMREATALYEGAAAYDHHRTLEELKSSTLTGLIGSYRAVESETDGLYGDLHLLPSATHAAEALDASIEAQGAGLPPLVGISHDVRAHFRDVTDGGRRLREATQIVDVQSADVVRTPAAGGKAVRAVAGGVDPTETDPAGIGPDGESTKESDVPMKAEDVLAALKTASPEQLAAVGLSKVEHSTESTQVTESTTMQYAKSSWVGKQMVKDKVADAKLPEAVAESLIGELPDRFTEADVDGRVSGLKSAIAVVERADLVPSFGGATVTEDAHDKKVAALDAFFAGDFRNGYRSFKEAFSHFSGRAPRAFDADHNMQIMRESYGGYDSDGRIRAGERTTESLQATSWSKVLGDSVTRRMIALYSEPDLQTWRSVVSDIVPVSDFRQQRRMRVGGYGTLPIVNEGAPYQPLTSPTDEEAVYSVIKRGGTDDLTLEMVANDDVGAIRNIPRLLGLAAAITLYRFVWDIFPTNAATSYDATALFHASHSNTAGSVLSRSALSAARRAMRKQAAFGDQTNILSLKPRTLVVSTDLEELGWELVTSAVAVPTSAPDGGASNIPNLHQGMSLQVIDYYSSATGWYTVADPTRCPTIEVGFYQGREDPELFTQSDPLVGSAFSADKITYKLRHMYSGTPLDHRGVYRGNS